MAPKPNILFVLTSFTDIPNSEKKTGWYLPEFAHPYHKLAPLANITIASPKGGEAPIDPGSIEPNKDEVSVNFYKDQKDLWMKTGKLEDFVGKSDEFDALFYVGGVGPMFDMADDTASHAVIREFYEAGKIVSAVCHGPIAFSRVKLSNGKYLVDGQKVTGFSDSEEEGYTFKDVLQFFLEDEMKKHGGLYEKGEDWGSFVAVGGEGGRMITGQNPASATAVADKIYEALEAR